MLQFEQEINEMKLLDLLRTDLNITHHEYDEALKLKLNAAIKVISEWTGVNDETNPEFVRLVLKRAMYDYNDQAEYFAMNYRADLNDLAISAGGAANAESSDATQ